MENEKVYIAIENGPFNDCILGVFKNKKDADDMILECGGYNESGHTTREIQTHEIIN